MSLILAWRDHRQNRLIVLFTVFTLSAWWILKNQIFFAFPLTQIESVTDLIVMSTVKDATLLSRWVAIYMDYGFRFPALFSAIHLEDWVFVIMGLLFCFPIEGRKLAPIVRIIMGVELLLVVGLANTVMAALSSTDTLSILTSIRLYAMVEFIVSILLMVVLFLIELRLLFHEYSD
jgi:hypothetical protein